MSDSSTPTPAAEQAVDPVAAARAVLAGQTAKADDVASLAKQIKALWIVSGVTIVLVVVMAIFTLLPRFGIAVGGVGARGNFRPGMMQNGQGLPGQDLPGQGTQGQGSGTTQP
jgi:hypothetical protein